MAIDTAEKRKAISGIWFQSIPGVTPNVAKDVEWRQQSGRGYSGIAPGGYIPPVGGDALWYPRIKRRRR